MNTKGALSSGSSAATFGNTKVIWPTAQHRATLVWLHPLNMTGLDMYNKLRHYLPLPNVKVICPTAPTRRIAAFPTMDITAWFDYETVVGGPNLEDMEKSAEFVAMLLSSERPEIPVIIGGVSVGGSVALHSAEYFAAGRFPSGKAYPKINLKAVVALGAYLHGSSNLKEKISGADGAIDRAASLPVLACHGLYDSIVEYDLAMEFAINMVRAGFKRLEFVTMEHDHYPKASTYQTACEFLISKLALQ